MLHKCKQAGLSTLALKQSCVQSKDVTKSSQPNVFGIVSFKVVDGRVFSLVLMYDGEINSTLLMITNT